MPASEPFRRPSIVRRLASMLYESLLLLGVLAVLLILPHLLLGALAHRLAAPVIVQAHGFLVMLIYCLWFWSNGRQTLAMKTWHIRIVDLRGQPPSQARALLRYLLSWLWFLPPLVLIAPLHLSAGEVAVLAFGWVWIWALLSRFHPQGQFWHDAWAGTRLIDVRPAPATAA